MNDTACLATPALVSPQNLMRIAVDAPFEMYVNNLAGPGGDGLTPETAMQQGTQATMWAARNLDLMMARLTINFRPNGWANQYEPVALFPYSGTINPNPGASVFPDPEAGFTVPTLRGDPSNPDTCVIQGNGGSCIGGTMTGHKVWHVNGIRMASYDPATGTRGGNLIQADANTSIYVSNCSFGPGSAAYFAQWDSFIEILRGGKSTFYGNFNWLAYGQTGGKIVTQGANPFDFSGHPSFAGGLCLASDGAIVDLGEMIFSGSFASPMPTWATETGGIVRNTSLLPVPS